MNSLCYNMCTSYAQAIYYTYLAGCKKLPSRPPPIISQLIQDLYQILFSSPRHSFQIYIQPWEYYQLFWPCRYIQNEKKMF